MQGGVRGIYRGKGDEPVKSLNKERKERKRECKWMRFKLRDNPVSASRQMKTSLAKVEELASRSHH